MSYDKAVWNTKLIPGENNFNIRNLLNVRKVRTSAYGEYTKPRTPLPLPLPRQTSTPETPAGSQPDPESGSVQYVD